MTFRFARYEPFDGRCDGLAHPGAKAWLAYTIDRFPGVFSLGIYNCRPPSTHGDGRADDFGIPFLPGKKTNVALGMALVNLYGPHAERLGITELIFNRRRWSAGHPGGTYYGGPSPHYDHVHGGLTLAAAKRLNYPTFVAVLGPAKTGSAPAPPAPTGAVPAWAGPMGKRPLPLGAKPGQTFLYSKELFEKKRDGNSYWIQWVIDKRTNYSGPMTPDGFFGQLTHEAVWGFQGAQGLKKDGKVGPKTWDALNRFAA